MFARTSTWSGSPEALQKWADHAVGTVKGFVQGALAVRLRQLPLTEPALPRLRVHTRTAGGPSCTPPG